MGNSNSSKRKELLRRVAANDFASVRHLIEIDRVNVNCSDPRGLTPLMIAIIFGQVQIGRYLIGKKADLDAVDNEGRTALGYAMIRNDVGMFRLLLESGRANVDQQFQAGQVNGGDTTGVATFSPLGFAIVHRNAMMELLLRFRANTVETPCLDETYPALHQACRYSSVDSVRLLLDHDDGVNVNTPVRWAGELLTPLCFACLGNNMEKARLLVGGGAQIIYDGVGRDTPRPLALAVIFGSMELIRFLLGKLPQGDNSPALSDPLETALRKNKLEVAQLLLENGANVNGQPYLYLCAAVWHHGAEGVQDRVSFLLEKGANVNMTNVIGETPLYAAAGRGSVALVKLFLNAEANVNIRSNRGETPLGVAYRGGHKGIVHLLLRTNPDVWPCLKNGLKSSEPTIGEVLLGGMLIVRLVFLAMPVTWLVVQLTVKTVTFFGI